MESILEADTGLQKLIDACRIEVIEVRENLQPDIARQTITRYMHHSSRYEVAIISDYVKKDGAKFSIISRLRVGNTVYESAIP